MEAIRKITTVKNGKISLNDLKRFNSKEVEVIILPLFDNTLKKTESQKKKFLTFNGIFKSGYKDTSSKIDELIYGK